MTTGFTAIHRTHPWCRRRAFTLIELLVVTGVILILAGITFALAAKINASAKTRATENVIRSLDQVLGEYELARGPVPAMIRAKAGEVLDQRAERSPLPAFGTPALGAAEADLLLTFPLVDGRVNERMFPIMNVDTAVPEEAQRLDRDLDPPQPTTALFLVEAARHAGVEGLLKSLGTQYVKRDVVSAWGWIPGAAVPGQFDIAPGNDGAGLRPLYIPTVLDAWGRPIRFVHPAFAGGAGAYADAAGTAMVAPARSRLRVAGPEAGQDPMNFDRSFRGYYRDTSTGQYRPAVGPPFEGNVITGDADEGRHPTGRPYFYSAGPDGNPGARHLNVYVDGSRPEYPAENARYTAD